MLSKSSRFPRYFWDWLPRFSVMDRYIATELTLPFLFGVGAFSSLGVSVGAVFEMIRRIVEYGLPVSLAVEVIILKFPEFIVLAFPMSALLATLMTYSRFSSDSELVALRSAGISVYRLVVPAVLLCFLVTGLTFAFNEMIVPAANRQAAETLAIAFDEARPTFQEKNILYPEYEEVTEEDGERDYELRRIFYARRFDGEEMSGLTILDFSRQGLNQIIVADNAIWDFDASIWNFFDGTIYGVSADGSFSNIATFEEQELKLPREPLDLASRDLDYNEMNIAESLDYLEVLRPTGNERDIVKLRVRIQQKIALPFICVAFGLVGAALGTQLRRTGRATGFAISILIIFGYYLTAFITGAIAQIGIISPFWGAWLPNIMGLVAGTLLLMRSAR
jgi:lipopolysaccharide export system permease protein